MLCLHFACLILGLWQKIRTTILYDESLEDGETEDKSVGIFNSFPTSAVVATHFAAMPLPPVLSWRLHWDGGRIVASQCRDARTECLF